MLIFNWIKKEVRIISNVITYLFGTDDQKRKFLIKRIEETAKEKSVRTMPYIAINKRCFLKKLSYQELIFMYEKVLIEDSSFYKG